MERSLALLLIFCLSATFAAPAAAAAPIPGIATEFGGAADKQSRDAPSFGLVDGACGYGNMTKGDFPHWKAAAISPNSALLLSESSSSTNKLGCGMCVRVACDPSRQLPFSPCKAGAAPVVVMVVDSCPDCAKDQINIHASAFQDFLGPIPKVAVTLERVPCDPKSNIVLKVTEARPSAGGFIRVAPQGVAGSGVVSKVEVRPTGSSSSSWTQATNAYGATWQASKFGDGVSSLDVRVTGEPGTAPVEATGAIYPLAKGRYGTAVQVNGAGTSGAVASSSSPSPSPSPAAPAPAASAPAPAPPAPAPAEPPAKAVALGPTKVDDAAPKKEEAKKAEAAAAPAPPPPPPPPPPAKKEEAKKEEAKKEEVAAPAAAAPAAPAAPAAAPAAPAAPAAAPAEEEIPKGSKAERLEVQGNVGGGSVAADILRSAGLAATAG